MRHVVHAIIVRELKTRFGEYKIGYLWLVLEPVTHLLVWMGVLGFVSRHVIPGVEYPVFLATGLLPWLFISNSIGRGLTAVESNVGLFTYRRVKPIDVFMARTLIELTAMGSVGLVLSFVGWLLGYKVGVYAVLPLVAIVVVICMFSLSLSVVAGVVATVVPSAKKIIPLVIRPFYFISAVMYPFTVIPQHKRVWLSWNPILHLVELMRGAWFGPVFPSVITSWFYSVGFTAIVMAGALLFYRVNERRLVTTV